MYFLLLSWKKVSLEASLMFYVLLSIHAGTSLKTYPYFSSVQLFITDPFNLLVNISKIQCLGLAESDPEK